MSYGANGNWREIRRLVEDRRHDFPMICIDFEDAPLGFSISVDEADYEIDEMARERSVGEECPCRRRFDRKADVKAFAIVITDESWRIARWLPLCAACAKLEGDELEHMVRLARQLRDGTAAEREYQSELL
jgi:hypothetical protein